MNLAVWAERSGVARVTAYRWFRAGLLAVPARKVGRLILVDEQASLAGLQPRTAVYARVTAWATTRQIPVGSARLYGKCAAQNRAKRALAAPACDDVAA